MIPRIAFIIMLQVMLFLFGTTAPLYAQDHAADTPLAGMTIYFTQSNSEAGLYERDARGISRFAQLLETQGATIDTITWETGIPADADLIVIAGSTDGVPSENIVKLWLYLNAGGRLLIAVEPLEFFLSGTIRGTARGFGSNRDFFELTWDRYGVRADTDLVMIESDSPLEDGDRKLNSHNIEFTTANLSDDSVITRDIDGEIFFDGARSMQFAPGTPDFEIALLVSTRDGFFGESDFDRFLREGTVGLNTRFDTPRGEIPLVASIADAETDAKIIIMGDVDLLTNGGGFSSSPPYSPEFAFPANVDLAMNSVHWLLDIPIEGAVPTATEEPAAAPAN